MEANTGLRILILTMQVAILCEVAAVKSFLIVILLLTITIQIARTSIFDCPLVHLMYSSCTRIYRTDCFYSTLKAFETVNHVMYPPKPHWPPGG